jgi:hypothetical protein
LELIGYVEKELTIGTMDRTKRALDKAIDPDEHDLYLSALTTSHRDQIDAILAAFESRNTEEVTFWQEFRDRVNVALQNEFSEEVGVRIRVKRPHAAKFEPRLVLLAAWNRDHLEQTGALPDLQFSQPKPVSANLFRRVGKAWELAFDGLAIPTQDSKGIRHIHYLLRRPGQPTHVLELVHAAEGATTPTEGLDRPPNATVLEEIGASSDGFGDAGPLADRKTIKQLWQRQKEIDAEIAEAEELGDSDRAEALRGEKDWILSYLAGAVGLDGKPRVAGSAEEKARTTVRQAIKRALEEIAKVHPSLTEHLGAISTGNFCCYDPPGDSPPTWEL